MILKDIKKLLYFIIPALPLFLLGGMIDNDNIRVIYNITVCVIPFFAVPSVFAFVTDRGGLDLYGSVPQNSALLFTKKAAAAATVCVVWCLPIIACSVYCATFNLQEVLGYNYNTVGIICRYAFAGFCCMLFTVSVTKSKWMAVACGFSFVYGIKLILIIAELTVESFSGFAFSYTFEAPVWIYVILALIGMALYNRETDRLCFWVKHVAVGVISIAVYELFRYNFNNLKIAACISVAVFFVLVAVIDRNIRAVLKSIIVLFVCVIIVLTARVCMKKYSEYCYTVTIEKDDIISCEYSYDSTDGKNVTQADYETILELRKKKPVFVRYRLRGKLPVIRCEYEKTEKQ